MNVRRASVVDVDAMVAFMDHLYDVDPVFKCWTHDRLPGASYVRGWLREPRTIAVVEDDSGIVCLDLFNSETGYSQLTCVTEADFAAVVPLVLRQEQAWTGIAPWGPVSSVPMLDLFLAIGCEEYGDEGLIRWVGP